MRVDTPEAKVTRTKTAVVLTADHVALHFDRENALRLAAALVAAAREVEGDVVPEVRVSGFVRTVGT